MQYLQQLVGTGDFGGTVAAPVNSMVCVCRPVLSRRGA